MKTTLPSGKQAHIGIHHTQEPAMDADGVVRPLRVTKVSVSIDGGLGGMGIKAEARSVCKGLDMFNKEQGRRIAALLLMRKLRDHPIGKEDKAFIFHKIMPDYSPAGRNQLRIRTAIRALRMVKSKLSDKDKTAIQEMLS